MKYKENEKDSDRCTMWRICIYHNKDKSVSCCSDLQIRNVNVIFSDVSLCPSCFWFLFRGSGGIAEEGVILLFGELVIHKVHDNASCISNWGIIRNFANKLWSLVSAGYGMDDESKVVIFCMRVLRRFLEMRCHLELVLLFVL